MRLYMRADTTTKSMRRARESKKRQSVHNDDHAEADTRGAAGEVSWTWWNGPTTDSMYAREERAPSRVAGV